MQKRGLKFPRVNTTAATTKLLSSKTGLGGKKTPQTSPRKGQKSSSPMSR